MACTLGREVIPLLATSLAAAASTACCRKLATAAGGGDTGDEVSDAMVTSRITLPAETLDTDSKLRLTPAAVANSSRKDEIKPLRTGLPSLPMLENGISSVIVTVTGSSAGATSAAAPSRDP